MGVGVDTVLGVLGLTPLKDDMELTGYSFNDTNVMIGAPMLTSLVGLEFVAARHVNQQTKRFQCLSGRGVFASNVNMAGVIEIGMLRGSPSQATIGMAQLMGIPFPIHCLDRGSGGTAQVIATGCQLVQTPEWKREALPGIIVYTFETTRLFILHGMQLPYIVT